MSQTIQMFIFYVFVELEANYQHILNLLIFF
jgi:hypothetical protein